MAEFAIRAEALSKQYQIGQLLRRHDTMRDQIASAARAVAHLDFERKPRETIWAIKDVSFEIDQGEIVGIIGRNGAGKTTLLRLLSRISEPTSGYADVRGRLRSLLEVGTGFHAELTGRENIYLNGAILGMRRAEVSRKFDEIVEFAGVEKFLDTPVKRYSSGMYVRLAFSVAAHLEPEILIVDEVLAVGDVEFQRKCLGKMESIGAAGRTVVFVSHSMPTILRLCERVILLDAGRKIADGSAGSVVAQYLHAQAGLSPAHREWPDPERAPGGDVARFVSVRVMDANGATAETLDVREPVGIELVFDVLRPDTPFVPWIALYNENDAHVFSAMDTDPVWHEPREPGRYTSVAWIPENLLNEGTIVVSPSLNTFASGGRAILQASANQAVSFQVFDAAEGDTARGNYPGVWSAPVRPMLRWTTSSERAEARVR
ncbi:MAG TPA: ABC transporter ATP-binding protein [Gaiellaceae bacterium]|nr:ABC transporter ATP-binding protein [Gaiellaceae bacterium]